METGNKLSVISDQIQEIINDANILTERYSDLIRSVHQEYRENALNLLHYLAFRHFDIDELQNKLRALVCQTWLILKGM